MKITRKEFLGRLIKGAAGIAGAAVVVGCGSSDGGSVDAHPPNCAMNGTASVIGGNHGHTLMVSKEDVTAGASKTYNIKGTSSHFHSVTVTPQMFTMLQANQSASVMSDGGDSTDNHMHSITIMCA